MERHDTVIDDGVLYLEDGDDRLEIGRMDDVVDLLGGESYTIEYDEEAQMAGWLRTDEDGTITFEVRETIADMDYDETFFEKMAAEPVAETDEDGVPRRTAAYADLMARIWDAKGNVDLE